MPTSKHHNAIYFVAFYALLTCTFDCFSQNLPAGPRGDPAPAASAPRAVAEPAQLAPFGLGAGNSLNPLWQLTTLPGNKVPATHFEWTRVGDAAALKLTTDQSYGVLTHRWSGQAPSELAWQWRLDQPLSQADITTKSGDDAALKVCVMFRQPLADIPLFQRAALALARSATGQDIPNATLCYLWDSRYPAGTSGVNPYTGRVRYLVLNGVEAKTGQWLSQQRRIADDFARLFGAESPVMPPVIAIAVGADSDNTQGASVAYLSQLRWIP
jgi:hypothetical protein